MHCLVALLANYPSAPARPHTQRLEARPGADQPAGAALQDVDMNAVRGGCCITPLGMGNAGRLAKHLLGKGRGLQG